MNGGANVSSYDLHNYLCGDGTNEDKKCDTNMQVNSN